MSIADRHIVKKGERIATHNQPIRSLSVLSSGQMSAYRDGECVAAITVNQFIGEINFLRMEELFDQKKHAGMGDSKNHDTTSDSTVQTNMTQLYNALSVHGPFASPVATSVDSPAGSEGEAGGDTIDFESLLSSADSFAGLHQLFLLRPALGVMLDRCISLDLSKKLGARKAPSMSPERKYLQVLRESILNGHISTHNKLALSELRDRLDITDAAHADALQQAGWTLEDYATGYQGGPPPEILTKYREMAHKAVSHDKITPASKNTLRAYRRSHNISHSTHLEVLKNLEWTPDEYEHGHRDK
eukprot:gene24900-31294_t